MQWPPTIPNRTVVTPQMIEECKAELPPVPVRVAGTGKTQLARTSGRKNAECTVSLDNTGTLHAGTTAVKHWHFPWDQVCKAVVSGVPLVVD